MCGPPEASAVAQHGLRYAAAGLGNLKTVPLNLRLAAGSGGSGSRASLTLSEPERGLRPSGRGSPGGSLGRGPGPGDPAAMDLPS
jgi:hypothetical protein